MSESRTFPACELLATATTSTHGDIARIAAVVARESDGDRLTSETTPLRLIFTIPSLIISFNIARAGMSPLYFFTSWLNPPPRGLNGSGRGFRLASEKA